MSHELDFSTGSAAIAYRGDDVPWHGFGNVIMEGDSIETIQEKAALNWTVDPTPSLYMFDGKLRTVPNRVQLVRSDTGESLSEMSGSNYKIRQPSEILGFFKGLTENNGLQINVAGALHGGKKVWALAERVGMGGTIGEDLIKPYILLIDSYDGTHATTARWTSVRVVCQNTLSFSEKDRKTQVKRKHSQEFDIEGMHLELGEFDESFKAYIEAMQAMAKVKISDKTLERYFGKLYAPDAFADESKWLKGPAPDFAKVSTNKRNTIADLLNLVRDNPGASLASADTTLYGALQTVTYFHDHEARTKGNKRWESATVGAGNRMKDAARELAYDMLG